jgi:ferritin-like metal-binding protein YciE
MGTNNDQLKEKLYDYLQDAHAMELNVQAMLTSMIAATNDEPVKRRLEEHLEETKAHAEKISGRLGAHHQAGSARKQVSAIMGAGAKGLIDQVRGDKPGKNARDAYVTEALEIAAYELLMRLADRAGDERTVAACKEILAEEEGMRRYIERNWDRFLDMTLVEDGVTA